MDFEIREIRTPQGRKKLIREREEYFPSWIKGSVVQVLTAQPDDYVFGGMPMREKNLRAIRAALVVSQDREAFDAGLKTVLDEVRVSPDLGAAARGIDANAY